MRALISLFCLFALALIVSGCSSDKADLDSMKAQVTEAKAKAEAAAKSAEDVRKEADKKVDEAKKPVSSPGHLQSMRALDSMVEAGKSGNSGGTFLKTADTSIDCRVGDAAVQYEANSYKRWHDEYWATLPTERAELILGTPYTEAKKAREAAEKKLAELETEMNAGRENASAKERLELIQARTEAMKARDKAIKELKACRALPPKVVERMIPVDRVVTVEKTVEKPVDRVIYRKWDCRTGSYYNSPTP